MQYFVSLGEHVVHPVDTDTWLVQIPWDNYPNPVDGTRIVGVWARRVAGNNSLELRSVCPTAQEDGTVMWLVEWSAGGSALGTTEMVGLVSDGVTQAPA